MAVKKELRIGIAGLGTVGGGVVKILYAKGEVINARAGREIIIHAVAAKNKKKKRGFSVSRSKWYDDPIKLAEDKNIDVVVELIGGADGVAYNLAKKSLQNRKSFVTANKALVARHGVELAELAEKNGVAFLFEGSVGGGIPVIAIIKEGLAANGLSKVSGILNGTCNYVLTAMQKDGKNFNDALREAQQLGYAEADPSFDVDGVDAANKLAILTSLAFGVRVNLEKMHVEGVRNISLEDIKYAGQLGYKIKLLGIAKRGKGGIEQRVHPCLIPEEFPIAQVDGVLNAISIESDSLGPLFLEGAGAGEQPTASAVVADIIDVAAGRASPPFSIPVKQMKNGKFAAMDDHEGEYYLRLTVKDEPGVLAQITTALGKEKIGVEQVLQPHTRRDRTADIVITTHTARESAINNVLASFSKMSTILEAPKVIRIEG